MQTDPEKINQEIQTHLPNNTKITKDNTHYQPPTQQYHILHNYNDNNGHTRITKYLTLTYHQQYLTLNNTQGHTENIYYDDPNQFDINKITHKIITLIQQHTHHHLINLINKLKTTTQQQNQTLNEITD